MKEFNIKSAFFDDLHNSYNEHKESKRYLDQLLNGLDYMEALVKFLGVVSISVLRDVDYSLYKSVFYNSFKLTPSLGHFIGLSRLPFSKESQKTLAKDGKTNELYDFLQEKFSTQIDVRLASSLSILLDESVEKKVSTVQTLLDSVGAFRNKFKGHSASFRDDDVEFRDSILTTQERLLSALEEFVDSILQNLSLFYDDVNNKVSLEYKNVKCELVPILLYVECSNKNCQKNQKIKLFFYNEGRPTLSHYLDYINGHYFQFTKINQIYNQIEKMQDEVIHTTSNRDKQTLLLTNFVGREEELKQSRKHIEKGVDSRTSSFVSVMGIPGIGKSAFITQVQQTLLQNSDINSYTFYAMKGEMADEELFLWKKISRYFEKLNIVIKEEGAFHLGENLSNLFEAYELNKSTKPLILTIDGLDEFDNSEKIIQSVPSALKGKIHIIFSSRPYQNIKSAISKKIVAFKKVSSLELALKVLSYDEISSLLSPVIPKRVHRSSDEYADIITSVIQKSESLPLYLYYIVQELKEKNITDDEDIVQRMRQWAQGLPKKLASFYSEKFNEIKPISKKILLTLLLSKEAVKKDDFYTLLQHNFKEDIGRTSFDVNYFNEIEVFLKIDGESRYRFYHLSVEEELFNYLRESGDIYSFDGDNLKGALLDSMIKKEKAYIDSLVYMREDSILYRLLQELLSVTKKIITTQSIGKNFTYYSENYLYLLQKRIYANVFISLINHENMADKEYSELLSARELNQSSKDEIAYFYKELEAKEQVGLFEIRFAYEFALLSKEYDKVLKYKDMYEDHTYKLFLDISLNIDKEEYVRKFIKHKQDWFHSLTPSSRDFYVEVMKRHRRIPDSFCDILKLLSDKYKPMLMMKLSREKALQIASSVSDSDDRSAAEEKAKYFVEPKMDVQTEQLVDNDFETQIRAIKNMDSDWNREISILDLLRNKIDKGVAKEIAYLLPLDSEYGTLNVIESLVFKDLDDKSVKKLLEIIESMSATREKLDALFLVQASTDNKELLFKILKSIESISSQKNRSILLEDIRKSSVELLKKDLYDEEDANAKVEIYKNIIVLTQRDKELRELFELISKTLAMAYKSRLSLYDGIVQKTSSTELLEDVYEEIKDYQDVFGDKYILLSSIAIGYLEEDISKSLKIAQEIAEAYDLSGVKNVCLENIGVAMASYDKVSALKLLEMFDGIERYTIMGQIANVENDTDLQTSVENLIDSIPQESFRVKSLTKFAIAMDKEELLNKALLSIQKMDNRLEQSNLLKNFIVAYAQYDVQKAYELLMINAHLSELDVSVEMAMAISTSSLEAGLEFAYEIDDYSSIGKALLGMDKRMQNNKAFNLFSMQVFISKYPINRTLTLLSKLSDNTVVKYLSGESKTEDGSVVSSFVDLYLAYKLSIKNKDRDGVRDQEEKFSKLKSILLEDENLLEAFLKTYGIALGLEDAFAFEYEFSLKDVSKLANT